MTGHRSDVDRRIVRSRWVHPSAVRAAGAAVATSCLAVAAFGDGAPAPLPSSAPDATHLKSTEFGAGCVGEWLPALGEWPGTDGPVNAIAEGNLGDGPAVFIGGDFEHVGASEIHAVARWDGHAWSKLGGGIEGKATMMAVFDDGDGACLYVAGALKHLNGGSSNTTFDFVRFDGTTWSVVQGPVSYNVHAMCVFDAGTGAKLFVASGISDGGFRQIAALDGTGWSNVGGGANAAVWDLVVHDDGTGPALYAGGEFTTVGNPASPLGAPRIAKWDGANWSALPSTPSSTVRHLASADFGNGPELIAWGEFTSAGGVPTAGIASWNGRSWSPLGDGVETATYEDMVTFDDGDGQVVVVTGMMSWAGEASVKNIARWDGSEWSKLGAGLIFTPKVLGTSTVGGTPRLLAGGTIESAGGLGVANIAQWSKSAIAPNGSWGAIPIDEGTGPTERIRQVFPMKGPNGPELLLNGDWTGVGSTPVHHIARWDGTTVTPLGNANLLGYGSAFVHDDGFGEQIYMAGRMGFSGQNPAWCELEQWNGTGWSCLGAFDANVAGVDVWNDGVETRLVATGSFTTIDGVSATRVASWDGSSWSPLGEGLPGVGLSIAALPSESGDTLFVSHQFLDDYRVSMWNGSEWTSAGDFDNNFVRLDVADLGDGPELYAFGNPLKIDGVAHQGIVRWNGTGWDDLAGDLNASIQTIHVLDDGHGPALYVGGTVTTADGAPCDGAARWNREGWSTIETGFTYGTVFDITSFDDGNGPILVMAGEFTESASGDVMLALYRVCEPSCAEGDVQCNGTVAGDDIAAILGAWGPCADCPEDLNGDGVVDGADITFVLGNWS